MTTCDVASWLGFWNRKKATGKKLKIFAYGRGSLFNKNLSILVC